MLATKVFRSIPWVIRVGFIVEQSKGLQGRSFTRRTLHVFID